MVAAILICIGIILVLVTVVLLLISLIKGPTRGMNRFYGENMRLRDLIGRKYDEGDFKIN